MKAEEGHLYSEKEQHVNSACDESLKMLMPTCDRLNVLYSYKFNSIGVTNIGNDAWRVYDRR